MINIRVCKLSEILSKIISIIILIVFSTIFINIFKNIMLKYNLYIVKKSLSINYSFDNKSKIEKILELTIPLVKKEYKNNEKKLEKQKFLNAIVNNEIETKNKVKNPTLLKCEKMAENKYKIGSVIINDFTRKDLNFRELEKSMFANIEKDSKVLIYHTHTSEAFKESPQDSYHSEDNNFNIVKVGETLKNELNKYNFFVRQDITKHDSPSYNGAYKSSLKSVENILKNENYDIIIDIHRDALSSNSQYRPTAEINGETVAKLMFVVGTDASGLKHDNWMENLKFAISFQERANELFPGLFRNIHLSTSRYNQHTSDKTLILEVGATGNSIEEACLAMKYFAIVLKSLEK